jgi:hypothetical protein
MINIEVAVRKSKTPFIRSLPHFVVRLMEKIIHQDEMNATIQKSSHLSGIPFVNSVLEDWNVNIIVEGSENIPRSGRFVFVANHPVGAMDSLAFLSMIDIVSSRSAGTCGYATPLDRTGTMPTPRPHRR